VYSFKSTQVKAIETVRTLTFQQWVAIEASMLTLLLNVFDRRWARDTLASRGSRADTHYHIVTTFEAKESGAPGVLAQSLGISERLE
jgi:hypothetical protein